jgi:hypothetical protein
VVDAARIPDFLRGSVSPDVFLQASRRFNDLEQDTSHLPTQCLEHLPNNAIRYLTADGAVFGPIGSGFRVRRLKHDRPLRADDMADADKVA